MTKYRKLAVALICSSLVIAACGGDDDESTATTAAAGGTETTAAAGGTETTAAAGGTETTAAAGEDPGVAAAKALIPQVWGRTPEDVATLTARTIAGQRGSAEGQDGLRAFLEKREPGWVVR